MSIKFLTRRKFIAPNVQTPEPVTRHTTKNLAERQLRPAVIARKISAGNKTLRGSHTFEIIASLAATCYQTDVSFIDLTSQAVPLDSS